MKRAVMIGALMVSGCATDGELLDGSDERYAPELLTTMTITINGWSESLTGDAKYVVNHPSYGDYISVTVNNVDHTKSVEIKTFDVGLGTHPIPNEDTKLIFVTKDGLKKVGTGHINISIGVSTFGAKVGSETMSGQFNLTADSVLFECYKDNRIDLYLESEFCQKAHNELLAMLTPGDSA